MLDPPVPLPVAVRTRATRISAWSPAVAPPEPYPVRSLPTTMVLLEVPVPVPVAVRTFIGSGVAVWVPCPAPVAVRAMIGAPR